MERNDVKTNPFNGGSNFDDYLGVNRDKFIAFLDSRAKGIDVFLEQDDETIKKEIRERLKAWFNNKISNGALHIFEIPPRFDHLCANARNNPNIQYGEKINSDSNGNRYRINPPKK